MNTILTRLDPLQHDPNALPGRRKTPAMTLALAALAVSFGNAHAADTEIHIRVSFKVVLNPVNGARPQLLGAPIAQADIDTLIDDMNDLMASYGRGYRLLRTGSLTDVGSRGGFFSGPSQWYNVDFFEDADARDNMEDAALDNPAAYAWNFNAINIYIVNDFGGAKCSRPANEIIVASVGSMDKPLVILHEIGHYFDLCHTQGCACADCAGELGTACTSPGDDEIADTLLDVQCWDLDDIAQASFFQPYDALPLPLREQVVDTARNLMSYHHLPPLSWDIDRLTEGQLDHWTGTVKAYRVGFPDRMHVVDGLTFVVPDDWTLGDARNNAGANDIILLRPGTRRFISTVTLDEPTTYRVTRAGPAVFEVP